MKTVQCYIKGMIATLLFFMANTGFSSPQSPDLLIYNGDTVAIYTLLLEQYFDQIEKHDDIEGKLFGLNFRTSASLNCWRGYQAIFRIKDERLWLDQITSCNEYFNTDLIDIKKSKSRITEIFGDKVSNGEVLVDWFSGNLNISRPNSKLLRWDGVFVNTFEEEILIQIKKGEVQKISEIENYIDDPNTINRRYEDTLSNIIFNEVQKVNWKNTLRFDCSEVYLVRIGGDGRIKKIIMPDYQTKEQINEFWDSKREFNYCIKTLTNGLKNLEFDILKESGRAIEEDVYIEIWFNEDGTIENWTN